MTVGNTVVLGLQWGDEGKGKVIDLLAGSFAYVVRCQGGANAGHTVVVDGRKTVLHLLPSGALHEAATCLIGNGVVVDPVALSTELDDLGQVGTELERRLRISDRAHLVLPCHKTLDAAIETRKGAGKAGTTLRGIGPTYADKAQRLSLRAGLLREPKLWRERFLAHAALANEQLRAWGHAGIDPAASWEQVRPACERAAPLVADTVAELHQAVAAGQRILFEGAQGVMLDIDHGTYPYVTSSNTGVGGVITGSGVSHRDLGLVIGIVKAYTTRVGAGPFPVELDNPIGEALRKRGNEYGATTGRPRRCGWLDLAVVDYACKLNGVDAIALTKLDVLTGEPELPVCVGYQRGGRKLPSMPADSEALADVEPVYERLGGWSEDISGCRDWAALPAAARAYVEFIERRIGVRIGWIGTGAGRNDVIVR